MTLCDLQVPHNVQTLLQLNPVRLATCANFVHQATKDKQGLIRTSADNVSSVMMAPEFYNLFASFNSGHLKSHLQNRNKCEKTLLHILTP
jgi:hypothetical protein